LTGQPDAAGREASAVIRPNAKTGFFTHPSNCEAEVKPMLREFREFITKGNALDMAVGIIVGVAFGAIVASFAADILLPPIGVALGGLDFTNLFIRLAGPPAATLAEAKAAGAVTLNYGVFINKIVDFIIIGLALFLLVRQVNQLRRREAPQAMTKECPYCFSTIALRATRCPQCTSPLAAS
jgi:large conductance mechanosensitive channel